MHSAESTLGALSLAIFPALTARGRTLFLGLGSGRQPPPAARGRGPAGPARQASVFHVQYGIQ